VTLSLSKPMMRPRMSFIMASRRIPGSPIGGRHGHARSTTRSANAGDETAWSFQGLCGAAWPCRPPASPMRHMLQRRSSRRCAAQRHYLKSPRNLWAMARSHFSFE
jgi:hypothetical protein